MRRVLAERRTCCASFKNAPSLKGSISRRKRQHINLTATTGTATATTKASHNGCVCVCAAILALVFMLPLHRKEQNSKRNMILKCFCSVFPLCLAFVLRTQTEINFIIINKMAQLQVDLSRHTHTHTGLRLTEKLAQPTKSVACF